MERNNNTGKQKAKLLCVTNRHLCEDGLTERLLRIARAGKEVREAGGPELEGIILREKDLSEGAYDALAQEAEAICEEYGIRFIRHYYPGGRRGGSIHMPLERLVTFIEEGVIDPSSCDRLGASCHSAEDARTAEALGCTYVSFGHVFETDCKKDVPPRGLAMLENVAGSVDIPVYAIGGISPATYRAALDRGAAGVCVMSGLMRCEDPAGYLLSFE